MLSSGSGPSIRIGTAGWDYPDWNGVVYPARAARSFDRLAFLSRFVDMIEINSTFYRPANPRSSASWAKRVRADFRFTAKALRDCTHEPDADLPKATKATVAGLDPLREAGMLGAVLLQFPQSFHEEPASYERLERLREAFGDWPLVVEVRHVSWDDENAAEWARARGLGWCAVDQPKVGGATAPLRARATSAVGYLRCHGRNGKTWFREDAGRDARYDYLYSMEELAPLAQAAMDIGKIAGEVFVVQNNHFRGQALVNALQLKHLIAGTTPAAPTQLVRSYPELTPAVVETPPRLI